MPNSHPPAFLAIYRPVIYRLARSRGLQDADADDMAQQVFVSISRAVESWTPAVDGLPFRAWLYRIAYNEILQAITRRKPGRFKSQSTEFLRNSRTALSRRFSLAV